MTVYHHEGRVPYIVIINCLIYANAQTLEILTALQKLNCRS